MIRLNPGRRIVRVFCRVANSTSKRTTPAITPRATAPMRTIHTATGFTLATGAAPLLSGHRARDRLMHCALGHSVEICPELLTGVRLATFPA
jgi:hypothetical protein